MKNILVTGCAGFIGTNLIEKLLKTKEYRIIGVDNFNPYYDVRIKEENVQRNLRSTLFDCINAYITDQNKIDEVFKYAKYEFKKEPIDAVVHLAAQAGVGYSIEHPLEVIDTNIKGFDIMIRKSHEYGVKHFIYASSSTVLGDHDGIYEQKSPYGVTKATNEAQGRMYAKLFGDMQITGLRLYTVYGERMRPDLAIAKFSKAIWTDDEIHIFGNGNIYRDFTYIDDVTEAFKVMIDSEPKYNGRVYDVGNGKPYSLLELIDIMKKVYHREDYDKVVYEGEKPYDAHLTTAWAGGLKDDFGFYCKVGLEEGLTRFAAWSTTQRKMYW
jgi:UDP-glucuronate 4-epimerase